MFGSGVSRPPTSRERFDEKQLRVQGRQGSAGDVDSGEQVGGTPERLLPVARRIA
jgi:hypothetical protein